MEEGTKAKKTIFIGGIGEDVNETVLYEHFSAFGDIIQVQVPTTQVNQEAEPKNRGFGFVTYGSSADAQDAIDNMDMNELKGRVIKVKLAKPMKGPIQPNNRAIWESEEWLREHAKPLAESGGVQARAAARQAKKEQSATEETGNEAQIDEMEE